MKCILLMPLAFAAGIDGFHLFIPYAAGLALIYLIVQRLKPPSPRPVKRPVAPPSARRPEIAIDL